LRSRGVIGHATIRLLGVDFPCVVHIDHASIWLRYVDTERKMEEGKEKEKSGREGKRKVKNGKEKRNGR